MNSKPLQKQQQQLLNRYDKEWLAADNLQLPIFELSQFPTLVDLPLFASKIPAGFPSPADDHLEATIDALEEMPSAKKQILTSRSFGGKLTDFDDLRAAVTHFAARSAEKLRHQRLSTQALTVFIQTSPFDTRH